MRYKRPPALLKSIVLLSLIAWTPSAADQLPFDEHIFYMCKWNDFDKQASQYIASGSKTQPHFYTMLAIAQRKTGKYQEAERTLRAGVKKYPDDPLCYTALADWLASKANDPKARAEAIALLKTAKGKVKYQVHGNSYDYLPKQIAELEKAPVNQPFPEVSPGTRAAVDDLASCGFFKGKTRNQVICDLQLSLGSQVSKPVTPGMIEAIALLDSDRFVDSPKSFYAEIELESVSRLGAINGFTAKFLKEAIKNDYGDRIVDFTVNGKNQHGQIRTGEELFSMINKTLASTGFKAQFYKLSVGDQEERVFGLMTESERNCLKQKGLFKNAVKL